MNTLLYKVIAATFLLSTLDAVLTIVEVENGWAHETNALMGMFLSIHPVLFFLVKSVMVAMCLHFLWEKRNYTLARGGVLTCFAVYSGLIGYHIHGLSNI